MTIRNMKMWLHIPISVMLLIGTAAQAQDSVNELGACQTLGVLMRSAVEADPTLAIARSQIDIASANLQESKSVWRPQLSAFAQTGYGDSGLVNASIENQAGLRVSQRIFDFGQGKLSRVADQAFLEGQKLNSDVAEIDVAYTVSALALTALKASETQDVLQQTYQFYSDQLIETEALLDQGLAIESDAASLRARLSRMLSDRERQTAIDRQATTELSILVPKFSRLCPAETVSREVTQYFAVHRDLINNDAALLDRNKQLQSLGKEIDRAKALERLERKNRLPVLSVEARGSYTYDDFQNEWGYRDRIGLDVSVPLYTGSALAARQSRARAEQARAEHSYQLGVRDLRKQQQTLSVQADSLDRHIAFLTESSTYLDREIQIIKDEVSMNVSTMTKLLEAYENYEATQRQIIDSRYNLMMIKLESLKLLNVTFYR